MTEIIARAGREFCLGSLSTVQCERERLGLVAVNLQCEGDHWTSRLRMEPLFFQVLMLMAPVFVCELALNCRRSPVCTSGSPVRTRQCEGDHCASRLRMEPLVRRAKSCPCLTCSLIIHPPTPCIGSPLFKCINMLFRQSITLR